MPSFSCKITKFGPKAGFGIHAPARVRLLTKEEEVKQQTVQSVPITPWWLLPDRPKGEF